MRSPLFVFPSRQFLRPPRRYEGRPSIFVPRFVSVRERQGTPLFPAPSGEPQPTGAARNGVVNMESAIGTEYVEESSRTANLGVFDSWNSKDDEGKVQTIKEECLKRIDEVRQTNKQSTKSAAFMSIPATLIFLSRFDLESYRDLQSPDKRCRTLEERFLFFCDKYFLGKEQTSTPDKASVSSLLNEIRIGLLEGATLSPRNVAEDLKKFTIKISQRQRARRTLKDMELEIEAASRSGKGMEVLFNSDELCNEMEKAVTAMFAKTTKAERKHIINLFSTETPLLSHDDVDTGRGIVR